MKDRNSRKYQKIIEWLSIADTDLLVAQQSLNLESDVKYRMVGFHAQQCAEEYLKGYLVYHDVDFPYTHNISSLLELCAKHGDWTTELEYAEKLTVYATTLRYPGIGKVVSEEEAINAIDIATRVHDVVRNVLIAEGVEL